MCTLNAWLYQMKNVFVVSHNSFLSEVTKEKYKSRKSFRKTTISHLQVIGKKYKQNI